MLPGSGRLDAMVWGEGHSPVLMRNNRDEIRAMVGSRVETSRMTGGYAISMGNQVAWNVPPQAIKLCLDISSGLAVR